MPFKDLLAKDSKAFTSNNEFGTEVTYRGIVINALFDEIADEALEGSVHRITVDETDVIGVSKNDTFTVGGVDYKVLDFQPLDGVIDIILNKRSV